MKFHCWSPVQPLKRISQRKTQVKLTREHHLVTEADLLSGEYDDILKGTFDTLVCAKHDEPLKLYCTEPSCLTPICTVSFCFWQPNSASQKNTRGSSMMKNTKNLQGQIQISIYIA